MSLRNLLEQSAGWQSIIPPTHHIASLAFKLTCGRVIQHGSVQNSTKWLKHLPQQCVIDSLSSRMIDVSASISRSAG